MYVCIRKWEVNKSNHPVPRQFHWQFTLTDWEGMRKVERVGFFFTLADAKWKNCSEEKKNS